MTHLLPRLEALNLDRRMYPGVFSYPPAEEGWSGGLAVRCRREAQDSLPYHGSLWVIVECVALSPEMLQEYLAQLESKLDWKHHLCAGRTDRSISAFDPRYEWFR